MHNSIKKNAIYNIIKTTSTIVFPFISFPYISRVLLPDNVGKIHFALSIISYFSIIATLGITTYAIRECASVKHSKEKLDDTSSQIFSINIITTIIAYLLLILTLIMFRRLDNYRLLIIIQSFSIIATTLGADWINSAIEDFSFITFATVAFQFTAMVLMFAFIKCPDDYIKYAFISLVSSSGANFVNIVYRQRICRIRFTFNIDWKKHISPIILLFVMILAQTIFTNVDMVMLGIQKNDWEAGIYSTANKLYSIVLQVITSLLWVIMPKLTLYFEKRNYNEVGKILRKVLAFNALIGLPCAVGCFMLADDIVMLVAGADYVDSIPVLRILMIGFLFTIFGGSFFGNSVLLPAKREQWFMVVCCITAVVNVALNYIFIPYYGAKAAAGTTAFCAFLIMILLIPSWDKKIIIDKWYKVFVSPIVGSGCIVFVCLLSHSIECIWLRTSVSVLMSVFVYFVVLILLKNELLYDLLKKILRKGFK